MLVDLNWILQEGRQYTTSVFKSDRRFIKFQTIAAVAAAIIFITWPSGADAHDIPNSVTVHSFLKPEGNRLNLLVRVPLQSMRDFNFPKRGPGYLDFADPKVDADIREAANLWLTEVELYEGDTRLPAPRLEGVRVSLPSDKSFESYEQALAHIQGPKLPEDTELIWEHALLDVWFAGPIQSDQSRFSIRPRLERLGLQVVTYLRFVLPDGTIRAFDLHGDPGVVQLDPRWHQAALTFVRLGFYHILDGIDHLLFLFCLVIPFRRLRSLVLIVTAFTVAHSITLIASAYDYAPGAQWFPPLVETLIATSIVYMSLENIVGSNVHRRWIITFAFGLVHGFGFSFALRETLQFAGTHLVTSLLAFNVGVELGQLLVLVLTVPVLELLFRKVVAERIGTIILSAIVAHTGLHWMIDRFAVLREFPMPDLSAANIAIALRWMMAIILVAGVIWFLSVLTRKRGKPSLV